MLRRISSNTPTPGMLPFLEEAVESSLVTQGSHYEILSVVESRKRTGFLLKCNNFQVFLYKSQPLLEAVLEALTELTRMSPAYGLFLILDDNTVEGFSVDVDDTQPRLWVKTKKSRVLDLYSAQTISESQSLRNGTRLKK